MEVKIYQINLERDANNVAFMGHPETVKFQKSDRIDGSIYDLVYEGDVPCTTIEDIYQMYNINHPTDFTGHSLSISDVVQIKEGSNNDPTFYFCDRIGFEKIHFEPELAQDARPKTIDVVLVEPGKLARQARIPATLAGMQNAVKGCIQAFYPFEEEVCIVCNEEGKITGMRLNRAVYNDSSKKEMIEIIAGPFFICDCSGENFGSLNEDQLKKYTEMFRQPERFVRYNDTIIAIPYTPSKNQER